MKTKSKKEENKPSFEQLKNLYGILGLSIPWMEYEGEIYSTILADEEYSKYSSCTFQEKRKLKAEARKLVKRAGGIEYLSFQTHGERPSKLVYQAGESPVRPFTLDSTKQPTPAYEIRSQESLCF